MMIQVRIIRKSDGISVWADGGYRSPEDARRAAEIQLTTISEQRRPDYHIEVSKVGR